MHPSEYRGSSEKNVGFGFHWLGSLWSTVFFLLDMRLKMQRLDWRMRLLQYRTPGMVLIELVNFEVKLYCIPMNLKDIYMQRKMRTISYSPACIQPNEITANKHGFLSECCYSIQMPRWPLSSVFLSKSSTGFKSIVCFIILITNWMIFWLRNLSHTYKLPEIKHRHLYQAIHLQRRRHFIAYMDKNWERFSENIRRTCSISSAIIVRELQYIQSCRAW